MTDETTNVPEEPVEGATEETTEEATEETTEDVVEESTPTTETTEPADSTGGIPGDKPAQEGE